MGWLVLLVALGLIIEYWFVVIPVVAVAIVLTVTIKRSRKTELPPSNSLTIEPAAHVAPHEGWFPDTVGRHEYRYRGASGWTDQVADSGVPRCWDDQLLQLKGHLICHRGEHIRNGCHLR